MNEINQPRNTSTPVVLPAKRKRGHPLKDGNAFEKGEESLRPVATPVLDAMRTLQQIEAKPNDRSMVGRTVSGIIDGSFNAGYLLFVRIGNNGTPLHGVILDLGRVMPISSNNDVASLAQLHQRAIPATNLQDQAQRCIMFQNQSASVTVTVVNMLGNHSSSSLVEKTVMQQNSAFDYQTESQSIPPVDNLTMVEQDEMMQVYEISIQSEGLMTNVEPVKDWMPKSTIKPRGNNVFPHKETMDQIPQYQKQDVGCWPEQSGPIHSVHNFSDTENLLNIEPQSVDQEPQNINSQIKNNILACVILNDPCHDLHQTSLTAKDQSSGREPHVVDNGFQPREFSQNQFGNLEVHETPILVNSYCCSILICNIGKSLFGV
ncbi:hypothetical protein ACH5RR_015368 [Cinchona calisaya]|uniref:Uncharacterized protein n=1 Tax=Cinchona calisaya TaxID=153742 RepID=A0ABD2ZSZ7_9GENT